jgi:hypothetical protein
MTNLMQIKAWNRRLSGSLVTLLMAFVAQLAHSEDATYVYTVQISATIQTSPPQITLHWPSDPYGANSFDVYRKTKDENGWNHFSTLPGSATSFPDSDVAVGLTYEYQIIKAASLGYTGYGYIYAGIAAPLTEDRGTLVLIVATNAIASLATELARLQSDLTGDGWLVVRYDVSSNDTPDNVKSLITGTYYDDPANVRAVFLFGHVPILQSGFLNYDGHLTRSMPADAFYGDMDGDWLTYLPATNRPSFLPSDVELMVGRVDLFNMPGQGAPTPWPSEAELLRNYLEKDHKWRHKLITVPHRALMGNLRGDENGEATAASGYRNFEPLVGPGNTFEASVEYAAPPEQRWISMLSAGSYLWAYGCGAGQPSAVSGLGTSDGTFADVRSIDVVAGDAQAVFVMLFGSWFGQWDFTDDLMRSFLATPAMGLACCLAGRPHWFCHHMGLGETIGYSTRLSMNNRILYQNQSNAMTRAVYVALMGDPTLRQDQLAPPSGLIAVPGGGLVNLSWSPSPDSVAGYHVYRAPAPGGPFVRLTGSLINATSFSDDTVSANSYTYMIRAVALQTTSSGSYFNPSQGIFASINLGTSINLVARRSGNDLLLTWNTQPGTIYHVQAKNSLNQNFWTDISGSITANGTSTSWTDPDIHSNPQRFYRIASP